MVTQPRIGGAAAFVACLGVLVLCTAAGTGGTPSGGVEAPEPGVPAAPTPATPGGGSRAPATGTAPAPPALEAVPAQSPPAQEQPPAQEPTQTTPTQPQGEQPPPQQEDEQEFQIDVPPEHKKAPKAPLVPALRPTGSIQPAAGRLAQTGVDVRLLAALGAMMIGVGLTLLGLTLPRRL